MKVFLPLLALSLMPGLSRHATATRAPIQQARCTFARPGAVARISLAPNVGARTAAPRPATAAAVLRRVADVSLPGQPVRFDYQSLDTTTGQLYISHMNQGHVVAFDTRTRRVSGDVADLPRVTGVWVVPQLHTLYASVTGHHNVAIIDLPGLTTRASAGPIGFPDGIAYVPGINRIFISDESVGGELVIDGTTDKVVAVIQLGGEAGNTTYDAGSGCVLVALQTLNQVVAVDPASSAVVGRFALARADHPHGMYVDVPDRVLYVANEGNATMEVVDLRTMQVTDIEAVGAGPDVLAFDAAWHRLYVATESGGLWVYQAQGERLSPVGVLELAHAHTVAVDGATHRVYLPLQNLDGHPTLRIMAGLPSKP